MPYAPAPPNAPGNLPPGYEFIASPSTPPRSAGPQSTAMRAIIVLGGLLLLLIIFIIIKGLFSGSSNKDQLLIVSQDQQELIHLATNAGQQEDLNETNKNFSVTAQLGLTSGQTQLISYMAKNGIKVSPKVLNLKVSAATDKQLTDAADASNYDETFRSVMDTKLKAYEIDLKAAYAKTKGPVGQKLLSDQYNAANLLLQQLNTEAR